MMNGLDLPAGTRRQWMGGAGLAGLAVLLPGCVSALLPDHVDVTDAELREAMAKRMPWRKTIERLGELTVMLPDLEWMPAKGRVAARFPLEWRDRGGRLVSTGSMGVSLGLAIPEGGNGITAQDPAVESLKWQGLPEVATALIRPALNLWVKESLQGATLHAWTPAQREQMSRYHLRPRGIEVLDRALRIRLDKGG